MTQFLATAINKSISTTGVWTDIDLSSNIPVGATGAIFRVRNTSAIWQKSGLRKKGSTDDRYGEVESVSHGFYIIAVDANRKCQGKRESTSIKFDLIGYTECDITLYTNGIDKSITPWNTWTDINLSSELPVGAIAAIFEVKNTASNPRMWSLRKKGSTDDRFNDLCSTRNTCFVVGVDGNRKCQGKIEDTQMDFYLIGYLTSGATETNGIDHSLGSLNVYTDITETNAPPGATGAFVEYLALQMSTDYAARKNGSSEDVYLDPSARHTGFFVGIDSNKKWEGKIEHIDNDFFTLGYFASGVTEVTKESSGGLTISEKKTKASSGGLSISGKNTKESSAGLSISESKTKASSAGLLIAPPLFEDFTTFTEVDVTGNRIQKTVNHIDHEAHRNESTYLYKDYGVGHFSDFEHKIKAKMNGDPGAGGWGYMWMLSNDLGDGYALNHNDKNHIGLFFYIDGTYLSIKVIESHNGTSYVDQYGVPKHNNWRYMKITKSGTDFKVRIYSDADYSTLLDTLSLTLHIQDNYRYLYGTNSYNDGSAQIIDIDIDNFNLGPEKTKLSSGGLSIYEKVIKESSASLSVSAEGEKVSSAGLRIVTRFIKESSGGLSIYGGAMKESSGGLSISGKNTKESSAGLSISESKTKASSAGLRIIEQTLKASSASLTIKAAYTKESSAGMFIIAQPVKQSSGGLSILGENTKESSAGLTVFEPALKKGLFYAKLGDTILETVMPENFRISKEINKIPSFEFEIANSAVNKTAIAANITSLFKIYWQHHGAETHIFTGVINADGIEYVSLTNIRISGFASFVKLGWPLYKHLDPGDAEPVNIIYDYNGTYTDYTFQANNATINDVNATLGGENQCFYVGENNPFWGLQIKYSTPGIPAGAVIVIEYSKDNGNWALLDVLDETSGFTEDAGTYDIIIPHPPSDWVRKAVAGDTKFWIRWRVISGAYTTAPKLDQIHTVNVDVYRVFYYETSAREILLDILEGTEYSMDDIDVCPEDEINIWAEYESPLRIIAAIPAALTWTDIDGSKKSYQWWIDEAKKVHIKQKRGTTYSDDITGDLTIFNNLVDYFNISNRLFGFSKRDGLSQIRAIIEDKASQTTHALREIAVPKTEISKYLTLKESLEKDIAFSKEPMQRLKGSVTTEFWGQRGYDVGDTVTLHQSEWVVDEGEFQIVKVDIGPILTQLNLGVSREHLEGLKSNMKRAFDISNVQMHGSTSLLTAGPETANYERKSDGSVFSAKLKIEIPSEVIKTHKVLLSWTIGKYRASVNDNSGDVPPHNHDGFALIGGEILSDVTGDDGGHTPGIEDGGEHTPAMLDKAHKHVLNSTIQVLYTSEPFVALNESDVYGLDHRHEMGITGGPDSVLMAFTSLNAGCECSAACGGGHCIVGGNGMNFATDIHIHPNIGHYTGYTEPNAYLNTQMKYNLTSITPYIFAETSDNESPAHAHTMDDVPDHPHNGVIEPDHDHTTPEVAGHIDHAISEESGYTVPMNYGIHEEAAGTVLELLINSEKIGEFSGPQTGVRIDGYLTGSTNTVEIQPVSGELGKKGSATISASGILFLEPRKF